MREHSVDNKREKNEFLWKDSKVDIESVNGGGCNSLKKNELIQRNLNREYTNKEKEEHNNETMQEVTQRTKHIITRTLSKYGSGKSPSFSNEGREDIKLEQNFEDAINRSRRIKELLLACNSMNLSNSYNSFNLEKKKTVVNDKEENPERKDKEEIFLNKEKQLEEEVYSFLDRRNKLKLEEIMSSYPELNRNSRSSFCSKNFNIRDRIKKTYLDSSLLQDDEEELQPDEKKEDKASIINHNEVNKETERVVRKEEEDVHSFLSLDSSCNSLLQVSPLKLPNLSFLNTSSRNFENFRSGTKDAKEEKERKEEHSSLNEENEECFLRKRIVYERFDSSLFNDDIVVDSSPNDYKKNNRMDHIPPGGLLERILTKRITGMHEKIKRFENSRESSNIRKVELKESTNNVIKNYITINNKVDSFLNENNLSNTIKIQKNKSNKEVQTPIPVEQIHNETLRLMKPVVDIYESMHTKDYIPVQTYNRITKKEMNKISRTLGAYAFHNMKKEKEINKTMETNIEKEKEVINKTGINYLNEIRLDHHVARSKYNKTKNSNRSNSSNSNSSSNNDHNMNRMIFPSKFKEKSFSKYINSRVNSLFNDRDYSYSREYKSDILQRAHKKEHSIQASYMKHLEKVNEFVMHITTKSISEYMKCIDNIRQKHLKQYEFHLHRMNNSALDFYTTNACLPNTNTNLVVEVCSSDDNSSDSLSYANGCLYNSDIMSESEIEKITSRFNKKSVDVKDSIKDRHNNTTITTNNNIFRKKKKRENGVVEPNNRILCDSDRMMYNQEEYFAKSNYMNSDTINKNNHNDYIPSFLPSESESTQFSSSLLTSLKRKRKEERSNNNTRCNYSSINSNDKYNKLVHNKMSSSCSDVRTFDSDFFSNSNISNASCIADDSNKEKKSCSAYKKKHFRFSCKKQRLEASPKTTRQNKKIVERTKENIRRKKKKKKKKKKHKSSHPNVYNKDTPQFSFNTDSDDNIRTMNSSSGSLLMKSFEEKRLGIFNNSDEEDTVFNNEDSNEKKEENINDFSFMDYNRNAALEKTKACLEKKEHFDELKKEPRNNSHFYKSLLLSEREDEDVVIEKPTTMSEKIFKGEQVSIVGNIPLNLVSSTHQDLVLGSKDPLMGIRENNTLPTIREERTCIVLCDNKKIEGYGGDSWSRKEVPTFSEQNIFYSNSGVEYTGGSSQMDLQGNMCSKEITEHMKKESMGSQEIFQKEKRGGGEEEEEENRVIQEKVERGNSSRREEEELKSFQSIQDRNIESRKMIDCSLDSFCEEFENSLLAPTPMASSFSQLSISSNEVKDTYSINHNKRESSNSSLLNASLENESSFYRKNSKEKIIQNWGSSEGCKKELSSSKKARIEYDKYLERLQNVKNKYGDKNLINENEKEKEREKENSRKEEEEEELKNKELEAVHNLNHSILSDSSSIRSSVGSELVTTNDKESILNYEMNSQNFVRVNLNHLVNTLEIKETQMKTRHGIFEICSDGQVRFSFLGRSEIKGYKNWEQIKNRINLSKPRKLLFIVAVDGIHIKVKDVELDEVIDGYNILEEPVLKSHKVRYEYAYDVVETLKKHTPKISVIKDWIGTYNLMSNGTTPDFIATLNNNVFMDKIEIKNNQVTFFLKDKNNITVHIEDLNVITTNYSKKIPKEMNSEQNSFKGNTNIIQNNNEDVKIILTQLQKLLNKAGISIDIIIQNWATTIQAYSYCCRLLTKANTEYTLKVKKAMISNMHEHKGIERRNIYFSIFPIMIKE